MEASSYTRGDWGKHVKQGSVYVHSKAAHAARCRGTARSRRSLSARTSALLGRGDGAARSVDLRAARVAVDDAGTRQTSRIARLFHEGEVLIIARLTGPATGVAVRTVAAIEVAERTERRAVARARPRQQS